MKVFHIVYGMTLSIFLGTSFLRGLNPEATTQSVTLINQLCLNKTVKVSYELCKDVLQKIVDNSQGAHLVANFLASVINLHTTMFIILKGYISDYSSNILSDFLDEDTINFLYYYVLRGVVRDDDLLAQCGLGEKIVESALQRNVQTKALLEAVRKAAQEGGWTFVEKLNFKDLLGKTCQDSLFAKFMNNPLA
jgi:hypothetical protein